MILRTQTSVAKTSATTHECTCACGALTCCDLCVLSPYTSCISAGPSAACHQQAAHGQCDQYRRLTEPPSSSAAMRSQMLAVRVSSHTIALCRGLPVWRSHSSIVSRWLVMPTARMLTCAHIGQGRIAEVPPTNERRISSSVIRALSVYAARADGNRAATSMPSAWAASSAPAMQAVTLSQTSSGSCSVHLHHQHGVIALLLKCDDHDAPRVAPEAARRVQPRAHPACGVCCGNSSWCLATTAPRAS